MRDDFCIIFWKLASECAKVITCAGFLKRLFNGYTYIYSINLMTDKSIYSGLLYTYILYVLMYANLYIYGKNEYFVCV